MQHSHPDLSVHQRFLDYPPRPPPRYLVDGQRFTQDEFREYQDKEVRKYYRDMQARSEERSEKRELEAETERCHQLSLSRATESGSHVPPMSGDSIPHSPGASEDGVNHNDRTSTDSDNGTSRVPFPEHNDPAVLVWKEPLSW